MTTRAFLIIIGFLMLCTTSIAQSFKNKEDLKYELYMEKDSIFPEADAIVLHRYVYAKVGMSIEVYEKIKILTKEGLNYATMDIPYYDVYEIKGSTYNLVDGSIESSELTKEMIFTDKIKYRGSTLKNKKVAFPKVRVGSIIEIHYKATRGSYADIDLQHSIPIKKLTVEVFNASGSTYRFVQNPRAYLKVETRQTVNRYFLSSTNVPALEHENYVYDMELYRAKLIMKRLGYNTRWRGVIDEWKYIPKLLFDDEDFKNKIKPKGIYKEEVSELIKNEEDSIERVKLVYNFLKDNIEWNEYFGIYPRNSTRETFRLKEGSVPDINILFVSMLRSIGIESYPILASSKMNGIHQNASREAFNYTLAGAKISNKWYVFDAASPRANFNYIPKYMVNWRGMILKDEDTFEWIDLTSPKVSESNLIANASLSDDLVLSGSIKERKTGYFNIDMRRQIKDSKTEKDSLLGISIARIQYENIDIKAEENTENIDISYDFSFEDAVEELGNQLYLSPLFFLSMSENPFKRSERRFPIDFEYPFSSQYVFTLKIPKGFEPIFIPEPIQVDMPNNYGSYFYRVSGQGENLQVIMKFQVKAPMIPIDYYEELKEFFKIRVSKENEKVILERTN